MKQNLYVFNIQFQAHVFHDETSVIKVERKNDIYAHASVDKRPTSNNHMF